MLASKLRFALFASGSGSNVEALLNHFPNEAEAVLVITDQPNAGVIERLKKYEIQVKIIPFEGKKSIHEKKIMDCLEQHQIDWILLAGYMRILSAQFIESWADSTLGVSRIVNIHPSLLPQFPGRDGYGDAFKSNVHESGITVHFVDAGMDTGPIIAQKKFARLLNDDLEAFKKRGLALEHQLYPEVVGWIVNNKIEIKREHQKIEVRVKL